MSAPFADDEFPPWPPYVGLVAFTEAQQERFFGRDQERRLLVHAVRAAKLTLLYGPSGVGKSSLLRAAVVPDLRALGERRRNPDGIPDLVPVVFDSWRDGSQELRSAVERAIGEVQAARSTTGSLADIVEVATETAGTRLVIVLDQFEQFFVYGTAPDDTLVDDLAECLKRSRLRASFLLSIREEALGLLDELAGRIRRSSRTPSACMN